MTSWTDSWLLLINLQLLYLHWQQINLAAAKTAVKKVSAKNVEWVVSGLSFSSLVIGGKSLSQFNLDQYGHTSKWASYKNEVEKIVKKLNESVGSEWRRMKKWNELQTIENERVVVTNEYVRKKVAAAKIRQFSIYTSCKLLACEAVRLCIPRASSLPASAWWLHKRSFSRQWMEQHCNVFSMDHTFIHSDDQYGIEGLEPLEE